MEELAKYLGAKGNLKYWGDCTVVGIVPKQENKPQYFLLLVEKHDITTWEAGEREYDHLLYRNNVTLKLAGYQVFKAATKLRFTWAAVDSDFQLSDFKSPIKKVYVLDREEQAELEQAKKTAKESARIRSSKWAHQRHEAARAILGVRKGRW